MQIRKGAPPTTVERELNVDLTRDEAMAILTAHVKSKMGPQVRFDDMQVIGDENDKLHSVTLLGVEIIPLTWKDNSEPNKPTPPPSVPAPPAQVKDAK